MDEDWLVVMHGLDENSLSSLQCYDCHALVVARVYNCLYHSELGIGSTFQ